MNDRGKPSLWTTGLVVLGSVRKQAEQAMRIKAVSNTPLILCILTNYRAFSCLCVLQKEASFRVRMLLRVDKRINI